MNAVDLVLYSCEALGPKMANSGSAVGPHGSSITMPVVPVTVIIILLRSGRAPGPGPRPVAARRRLAGTRTCGPRPATRPRPSKVGISKLGTTYLFYL